MKSRILAISMAAILLALAASGCGAKQATPTPESPAITTPTASDITSEGRLEPVRYAQLALNADGSISELLTKEGDSVQAGQVIAKVQNENAQTLDVAQANASTRLASGYQAVRDAQKKLDDYDIPGKYAGMTAAEATNKALAQLNSARDAFEPYKDLGHKTTKPTKFWHRPIAPRVVFDTGEFTGTAAEYKKQLDNAWIDYRRAVQWLDLESALESAKVQLDQAQKDYNNLQDSTFAEDTAGARAALANAELRSPFNGTITNLDLKVGEFAASGSPVVTVADFSSWVVKTTDLTEIDVVNIKEGQPVTLTLDAIPEQSFKGYVLTIGQNYSEKQGDIVYEVSVLLTDKNPAMRWGMTAKINFAQ